MLKIVLALALIASLSTSYAQKTETKKADDAGKSSLLAPHFGIGYSVVGGDLKTRFGPQNALAAGLLFLSKNNWAADFKAQTFFGNTVNEDPLAPLRTPEGLLIGNDRRAVDVILKSRAWAMGGSVGRLFSFSENQRASGVLFLVGAGWQQHKIRIQDDARTVVQIAGEYEKGYDRLTGGLFFSQTIGYQIFSKSRRVNVFLGLDALQSRSRSLRDFDFSLGKKDESRRLDLRFGPRIALSVPIYLKDKGEDIYY